MDAPLVSEELFSRFRILPKLKHLNSRSMWSSFGWSTIRTFSEGPTLSIGPFQKVRHEVICFPHVVRKK